MDMRTTSPIVSWEAPEYLQAERSHEWYIAASIICITLIGIAFYLGSAVFALFLIASAFALMVRRALPPPITSSSITTGGIIVGKVVYPFSHLESFSLDAGETLPKIILTSKSMFSPHISITAPLDVPLEELRHVLRKYLKEDTHAEPVAHKLLERLGF
jgi:hypothetical protein